MGGFTEGIGLRDTMELGLGLEDSAGDRDGFCFALGTGDSDCLRDGSGLGSER